MARDFFGDFLDESISDAAVAFKELQASVDRLAAGGEVAVIGPGDGIITLKCCQCQVTLMLPWVPWSPAAAQRAVDRFSWCHPFACGWL